MPDTALKAEFRWYLGDRFLGTGIREATYKHGQMFQPENLEFFCRGCGKVWARVVRPDNKGFHYAAHTLCPSCGGSGKLAHPYDTEVEQTMPRAVLEREIELICEDPAKYESITGN